MRATLLNMPWHALSWPSLAISVLDTLLSESGHQVTQYQGNVRFAEYMLEVSDGRLTPDEYAHIYDDGFSCGVGEWIFTSALYEPQWRLPRYTAFLQEQGYEGAAVAVELHHVAPDFIRVAADEVLAQQPELVGMTTSFGQNVASLALAQELKRRRPDLRIVFGGSNCDGPMGAALHRNFPQVDFVIRGEGELALTELMSALAGDAPFTSVTGLCWRDEAGASRANPYVATAVAGASIPSPNLRPFFAQVRDSPVRPWITRPAIRLETSRGCWWGEKRQCTFCGLNPGNIAFRAKPQDRAFAEISSAVSEFGVLDLMLTDNILDPAMFNGLLPRLADTGWDLRIFYEVKSNVREEQVRALAAAGVTTVQPGLENFSSRVLDLMDKGATGAGQVAALRRFREYGVFPVWNYLYGFPGEDWDRDYAGVVAQLPALVHLPPPDAVVRITLERFSPLYERPELGIDDPRLARPWYEIVYDLPVSELADLAYMFQYRPRGLSEDIASRLKAAMRAWREGYEHSALSYRAFDDAVVITDRRAGWEPREHVLTGLPAVTYLTLARHLPVPGLLAALAAGGYDADGQQVACWLRDWQRDGLVFAENDTWVALATRAVPGQQPGWGEAYSLASL